MRRRILLGQHEMQYLERGSRYERIRATRTLCASTGTPPNSPNQLLDQQSIVGLVLHRLSVTDRLDQLRFPAPNDLASHVAAEVVHHSTQEPDDIAFRHHVGIRLGSTGHGTLNADPRFAHHLFR